MHKSFTFIGILPYVNESLCFDSEGITDKFQVKSTLRCLVLWNNIEQTFYWSQMFPFDTQAWKFLSFLHETSICIGYDWLMEIRTPHHLTSISHRWCKTTECLYTYALWWLYSSWAVSEFNIYWQRLDSCKWCQ